MRRYRQIVHANAYARTSASSGPPPPPPPSGTPITLSFLGGLSNIYVVQYSSIGNPVWATNIGYTSGTILYLTSITTDSSSNVYVTGVYTSNLAAYNSNGTPFATTLTNPNTWGASFLVKYDSNRNVQFFFNSIMKAAAASVVPNLTYMAVDTNGNVNGTGTYVGTTTYYSQNGATSSWGTLGGIDWHIVQYSPAGNLNWKARAAGGYSPDQGTGVAVDSSNNVIVCGNSAYVTVYDASGVSNVYFPGVTGNYLFAFVIQYSSTGSFNWAARMGTGDINGAMASSVCVDSSNNITVSGNYGPSTSNFVASNGSTASVSGTAFGTTLPATSLSIFIVQYSSSGSVNWLTYWIGYSSSLKIARDSSNNIYLAGITPSSLTFYNAGSTSSVSTYTFSGTSNVVLAKYTSSGAFQWYCVITSNTSTCSLAVDSSNNITVGGTFTGTLTAYTSNASAYSNTLTDTVGNSRFIVQFSSSGLVNWVAQSTGAVTNNTGTSIDSGNNIITAGVYATSNITFNPHA